MQPDSLSYVINIIFRLLWSVLLTLLSSLVLIVLYLLGTASMWDPKFLLEVMNGLFLPLLLLFLFMTLGPYLSSVAEERLRPKFRMRSRIRRIRLETRALITQGCRFTTICLLPLFVLTVIFNQIPHLTDSAKSIIVQWEFPVYLFTIISAFLSIALINRIDWAIYNLERYQATHELSNLQKALKDYNRALGSTLPMKRLLAISQYVHEGLMIGNTKEKEDLIRQLNVLTMNLRYENICDVDRSLIDLSQLAEETVKKHKEFLGFEARYPFMLRSLDTLRSSLGNVFLQVMLVLIWIAALMILSYFGIKSMFPP